MICPILSQSSRDRDGNVLWEHHDCIENACTFWAEEARECGLRASGLLAVRKESASASPRGPGLDESALRSLLEGNEDRQREMGLKLLEGVSALEDPIRSTGQEVAERLDGLNAAILSFSTSLEGRLESLKEEGSAAKEQKPEWAMAFAQQMSAMDQRLGQMTDRLASTASVLSSVSSMISSLESTHRDLASALSEESRRHSAEADRRKCNEAQALNVRGVALYHRGAMKAAEATLRSAIEKDSGFAEAWNNLGLVLSREGIAHEAETCFARALELKPSMTEAMNNLGFLFHEGLEFEKAADLFRRAAAGGDNSIALLNLGNACHRLGLFGEAVDAWKNAVKSDPMNEAARRALGAFQQEVSGS